MKSTWNSSSVTPNPPPNKVMVKKVNARRMYWTAILYQCMIKWLMCGSLCLSLYFVSTITKHLFAISDNFTMRHYLKPGEHIVHQKGPFPQMDTLNFMITN